MKFGNYLFLFFFLNLATAEAQDMAAESPGSTARSTVKYLFPVKPGTPNTLAGTMGELRSNHFHSGLDIRTNNMVGAPILAAQEGYISRVTKSPYSYGNVLYITHPNGHTTLYAHLDKFLGEIGEHVLAEQYRTKSSQIDLKLPPGKFRVMRGDTVALSGNTGSSSGPHLHFDLRDEKMNAINPLQYGFDEIKDNIAPVVYLVALRTMDKHSRINGRFGRFEFRAIRSGRSFRLPSGIKVTGNIGIELWGHDVMNHSGFRCGINEFHMKANDQPVFSQVIHRIEMDLTRGILSVMDNAVLENTGKRFYKLYVDDGNPLSMYSNLKNRGIITVKENPVNIQLKMSDSYGNTSQLEFSLTPEEKTEHVPNLDALKLTTGFDRLGHHLIVRLPKCTNDGSATLYHRSGSETKKPDYGSSRWSVFIIDLNQTLPDSISSCSQTVRFPIKGKVPSHTSYTFFGPSYRLHFPDSSLFDTLYFDVKHDIINRRDFISIADKTVPLLRPINIEFTPKATFTSRSGVYRQDGGRFVYVPGKFENGKVSFSTIKLGNFRVLQDSIPPRVYRIALNHHHARFRIADELSGISSYEASVNGQWLALTYDYKTGVVFAEQLDKKTPMKGEFVLKVTDQKGNIKTFKQNIL